MTARRHHYVPQCYLNGFAQHREKPKLYVVDALERRAFRTSPLNIAAERDFHRIDADGVAPDALENAFSGFEGELDQALRRIVAARSISNENDRIILLNLVGLLAIKNPRLRETMRDGRERVMRMVADLMTATPERWEATAKSAQRDGYVPEGPTVSYEIMREFVQKGRYKIDVHPMEHMRAELKIFNDILPLLFRRKWMLLKAPHGATGFITCDHPPCLMWSDPSQRGKFYSPGLGLRGTDLFFPISNELAMIGSFEGSDNEHDANPLMIAAMNGAFVTYAERQVYARESDFLYYMVPDEKPRRGDTLLQDRRFTRPRPQKPKGRRVQGSN